MHFRCGCFGPLGWAAASRVLSNCFAAGKDCTKRLILAQDPTIECGAIRFVTVLEGPAEFFSTLLGKNVNRVADA